MRQIRDAAGTEWMVYQVNPTTNRWNALESLPEGYRAGWLCFESASEKRRLISPPSDWEDLPTEALNRLLGDAVQVRRSATPIVQQPPAR
jgi:hypothetical protein